MASLETTKNGYYQIVFWFDGERYKRGLGTQDERAAHAQRLRVDENIGLVKRGRLLLPDDADIPTFLLSDGQLNGKQHRVPKRKLRTLKQFSDAFLASIPDGALEDSTIRGMETHLRHLRRIFGSSFTLLTIELEDIQQYVEKRSKDRGLRGQSLSPATIKKEVTTLRTLWNCAKDAGHVERSLPMRGLRYPKGRDKPPFQTLAQIERRIASGRLSERQEQELWSALFLTTSEIDELLEHVRKTGRHPFQYPMFVFAAHTGARRHQ